MKRLDNSGVGYFQGVLNLKLIMNLKVMINLVFVV